jgi:hypothetical protein
MVSCPTSAITFKPVAQVKLPIGRHAEVMPAAELISDPLFAGVPPKFLLWQQGLVVKRHVKKGEVLCRHGDPGNTAFVIKSGKGDKATQTAPLELRSTSIRRRSDPRDGTASEGTPSEARRNRRASVDRPCNRSRTGR